MREKNVGKLRTTSNYVFETCSSSWSNSVTEMRKMDSYKTEDVVLVY